MLALFFLLILTPSSAHPRSNHFVYSQNRRDVQFHSTSYAKAITPNIGGADTIDQFTISGWVQFGGNSGSTNILTLMEKKVPASLQLPNPASGEHSSFLSKLPHSNSDDFLFSLSRLVRTPNEYTVRLMFSEASNKNHIDLGTSFREIPYSPGAWNFFAVSVDVKKGKAAFFYAPFDGRGVSHFTFTFFSPNPRGFRSTTLLYVGGATEFLAGTNPESMMRVSTIEIGTFFSEYIKDLWLGYTSPEQMLYKGVLSDVDFGKVEGKSVIPLYGSSSRPLVVWGDFKLTESSNQQEQGLLISTAATIGMRDLNFFSFERIVQSALFHFRVRLLSKSPPYFCLLSSEKTDHLQYLNICLVKRNDQYYIMVDAGSYEQKLRLMSRLPMQINVIQSFAVSLSISPDNEAYIGFWVENLSAYSVKLASNFKFDLGLTGYLLLGNTHQTFRSGWVELYRFSVLNSASGLAYEKLLNKPMDSDGIPRAADCLFYKLFYGPDPECLLEKQPGLDLASYSLENGKTPPQDEAKVPSTAEVKAIGYSTTGEENPESATSTKASNTWKVDKVGINRFVLYSSAKPSPTILSDPPLEFSIEGLNEKSDYTIHVKSFLSANVAEFKVITDKDLSTKRFNLSFWEKDKDGAKRSVKLTIYTEGKVHIFNKYRWAVFKNHVENLALVPFFLLLLIFLCTLLSTLLGQKRAFDLASCWKFLVHALMQLQLISFLTLLQMRDLPATKAFITSLYARLVLLRPTLSDTKLSLSQNRVLIFFLVELVLAFTFLTLKLWERCRNAGGYHFYRLLTLVEYTLIVVVFSFCSTEVGIFFCLTLSKVKGIELAMASQLVITSLSVSFSALMWFYFLRRLLGPKEFFLESKNYRRFYYFFTGYRATRAARSYDLWHWAVYGMNGLVLGTTWVSPDIKLVLVAATMVFLMVTTIFLRPFRSIVMFISDLLSQILLVSSLFTQIIFVSLIRSGKKSYNEWQFGEEGDALALTLLVASLLVSSCGLFLHLMLSVFWGDRYRYLCVKKSDIVQANYLTAVRDPAFQSIAHSTPGESDIENSLRPEYHHQSKSDNESRHPALSEYVGGSFNMSSGSPSPTSLTRRSRGGNVASTLQPDEDSSKIGFVRASIGNVFPSSTPIEPHGSSSGGEFGTMQINSDLRNKSQDYHASLTVSNVNIAPGATRLDGGMRQGTLGSLVSSSKISQNAKNISYEANQDQTGKKISSDLHSSQFLDYISPRK